MLEADGKGSVYDAGMWVAEHWGDISQAAQDPAYAAGFFGALAFAVGALVGGAFAAGSAYHGLDRAFLKEPGEVVLGHRSHKAADAFLRPLVKQRLRDRFMHTQVIGPTGQAKTTLLLSLAVQDLMSGLTVFVLETGGDLGERLLPHAWALGRPVYLFDPSSASSMKWNPLSGSAERAAEQAVSTLMTAGSSTDDFFRNLNATVLRRFVFAAHAVAERVGTEPTISGVIRLLVDERHRNEALGIRSDREDARDNRRGASRSPLRVTIDELDEDTKVWFERQFLGTWTYRQRNEFTMGLQTSLDMLLGRSMVRKAISPERGEEQIQLGEALKTGGLVVFRMPQGTVGDAASRALSVWVLQRFQQETLDRGGFLYPIVAYLDEVHNTLGHHNSAAAQSFSGWIAQVRKYNVGCYLAYQAFGMLPLVLQEVLATNARNKLISGGLDPRDAREAQAMMGFEEQEVVTDVRHTRRAMALSPATVSVGRREMERARYTEWEIRSIPRGRWLYSGVRAGRLMPPVVLKAVRPPAIPAEGTQRKGWQAGKGGSAAPRPDPGELA